MVLLCAACASLSAVTTSADSAESMSFYVGTYTNGKSEGIYRFVLDSRTGEIQPGGTPTQSVNPSFLAIHPSGKYLFAVNETEEFRGDKTGAVSAFEIDGRDGSLRLINQQPSGGGAPCHLVIDSSGKHVLVANYSGGSISSLPIGEDGSLRDATSVIQHHGSSVNPGRQKQPHAHSINLDSANRFAFAADLGLDQVLVYRFNASTGQLVPHDPSFANVHPGAGPRHFDFHPSDKYAYVINELDSTLTVFGYDSSRGKLERKQSLPTLPSDFDGRSHTAEVRVHPSGRFVYGSNRGHDSIAVFSVDQSDGSLTFVDAESTQGKAPRNFVIDPTGKFLLAENQGTDTIVVFRIDQNTGELSPTGYVANVPSPVCIRFMPSESN